MTVGEVWASEHKDIERWLTGRLCITPTEAEEAVAEATAQVITQPVVNAKLLWKVSERRALDLMRRATSREEGEVQLDVFHGQAIPTIETAMFRADFDRAFRQLPQAHAEAFALTELRGLTERETADVLGVSQMTINRRCEAARTFLQKELS